MKVNGKTVRDMAKERLDGKMEQFTKDNGDKTNSMVLEN